MESTPYLLNSKDRSLAVSLLSKQSFDLLIIGGGITGAGIALDASSRGLKVALVEKDDFASGTSSKSTKLIHGGLRYLKQFEIGLVREVGVERAVVHNLAPLLVKPEKMMLPLRKGDEFGPFLTSVGLWIYDLLAGVRSSDRRQMLNKLETLVAEPQLSAKALLGSGVYAEYRTDDARLTVEIIKTAAKHGALCLNYVEAVDFLSQNNQITGALCKDVSKSNNSVLFEVRATCVVNASGPWVDGLREKAGSLGKKKLFLSKGVHIAVPHNRLPLQHAVYFQVPDGRMMFCIPRHRATYIGTTDTRYSENPGSEKASQEDVMYLLDGVNSTFPQCQLKLTDVESTWAGLRPLIHEDGKSPGEISRKDEIFLSPNGMISIAGGKLTGYRLMAKKVTDKVVGELTKKGISCIQKCITQEIPLQSALVNGQHTHQYEHAKKLVAALELEPWIADNLMELYGAASLSILQNAGQSSSHGDKALILSELKHCLETECIVHASDFFDRRTSRMLFHIDSVRTFSDLILEEMSIYFGWTEAEKESERALLKAAVRSAGCFSP